MEANWWFAVVRPSGWGESPSEIPTSWELVGKYGLQTALYEWRVIQPELANLCNLLFLTAAHRPRGLGFLGHRIAAA